MDTADPVTTTDTTSSRMGTTSDWDAVNFNAPGATYPEITDSDIDVRGNEDYAIYSLDETILFDTDQSQLRSGAETKLEQVATSVTQRFSGGDIRIYGHTDKQGSAGYNKELAEQRAEAVKNWLTENGDVAASRISVHPVGESDPVASNETAAGRQQNRRVEIVARRSNSN
ncbi:OmpA family protein [Pontibacter beigongshangensis]|uniref:OmpA family protein n=1 Tax=Pontibacter beigongshangensis TaxID=2574733 RepID=UPI001F511665|nr:OmpA family protein [Pontibacter beigongshangensis]